MTPNYKYTHFQIELHKIKIPHNKGYKFKSCRFKIVCSFFYDELQLQC